MAQKENPYNKILVVEDDETLSSIIKKNLELLGFEVKTISDGKVGLKEALTNRYSLIIIDISLPNISGFDIVSKMKWNDMKTPTLIITNYDTNENELESFKRGANIFHQKPINFELFKTQVKSLLNYQSVKPVIEAGDLHIEPQKNLVIKSGKEIRLSPKEYRLLVTLISAKGDVLNRQDLLAKTFKGVRDLEEGSIDTLVCRLRKKLGKYRGEESLETIHGVGYRMNQLYFKKKK
jgi:two-component system alkaline phosphatase synthesis response regulator PhoP